MNREHGTVQAFYIYEDSTLLGWIKKKIRYLIQKKELKINELIVCSIEKILISFIPWYKLNPKYV